MKNYTQKGDVITVLAPADVSSGDGVVIGSIFGVAVTDANSGAEVEIALTGVYTLPKTDEQAWTAGVLIYWDATAGKATTVSGTTGDDYPLIGVATEAVAVTAGLITGSVRLNGSFTV